MSPVFGHPPGLRPLECEVLQQERYINPLTVRGVCPTTAKMLILTVTENGGFVLWVFPGGLLFKGSQSGGMSEHRRHRTSTCKCSGYCTNPPSSVTVSMSIFAVVGQTPRTVSGFI